MAFMNKEGQKEGRAVLLEAAIQHVGDYWLTGVGAGNYYEKWGFANGFARWSASKYQVYQAHNMFIQVMLFWGLMGLSAFLMVIWQVYRCLQQTYSKDVLAVGMLGIAITLLLLMPFASEFYDKAFSLGLGVFVAYQRWLVPSFVVPQASR
jgi:hypothetical protein